MTGKNGGGQIKNLDTSPKEGLIFMVIYTPVCTSKLLVSESDLMDTLPTHIPDPTHPPSGSPSTDSADTTLTLPSSADVLDLPSASAILGAGQTPASIFTQVCTSRSCYDLII